MKRNEKLIHFLNFNLELCNKIQEMGGREEGQSAFDEREENQRGVILW